MSFWLAIGLADRKTLESLMQQIQELKFKNGKLWEENKKLLEESIIWLSKKMQGQYEHVMQAQKTAVSEIEQKIYEAHVRNQKKFQLFEEDFGKLESGQDVLRQEITGHYDKLVGFEDQWLKRLERLSSTFDALQKRAIESHGAFVTALPGLGPVSGNTEIDQRHVGDYEDCLGGFSAGWVRLMIVCVSLLSSKPITSLKK